MPHAAATLAAIAAIWFAATLSPGPDFLAATGSALRHGRATARRTVAGIALGTACWGLAGFFGIHALFEAAPFLYAALKLAGGAYLALLGGRLLIAALRPGAAQDAPAQGARGRLSAFRFGLVTNLANPKAALFTTSLFAATLPPAPPVWLGLAATAIMTGICLLWYGLVVQVLTAGPAGALFRAARRWIDCVSGAAFLGYGIHLALDARRT